MAEEILLEYMVTTPPAFMVFTQHENLIESFSVGVNDQDTFVCLGH